MDRSETRRRAAAVLMRVLVLGALLPRGLLPARAASYRFGCGAAAAGPV